MAYGDAPSDKDLKAAWDRFCDDLKHAGTQAFKDANPANALQRADAFRFLTQNLGQAFDLALETKDPAFPQIHYFTTPTMKLGGDVADFTYRQAWISGEHTYRLTGKRGTARWLNVTVQGPRPETIPGTDWPSLHEPFGDIPECNILGSQLETDAEGRFELFIGGEERSGNWLPTTAGSRKLFIREAFDSWGEQPTTLTIERLGMAEPRPMPPPDRMIEAMEWAGRFVSGFMEQWPEHSWQTSRGVCDPHQLNAFPADKSANDASDAKRGRMAAHMIWRLRPDEALIVEMDMHEGFWIFGMGGAFMGSMDFLHRPVSYTPARTKVDADGVVRLVIAHDDPGVHNWLDTQGFSDGNLTYRNLLTQSPAAFRTRLVKRADLMTYLPADTATVTPGQRAAMLLERYRAIKPRFGI
ncbi:DUF1214 domain-containing protein [Novosphingobium mangrovi (ex Huang et al. 2023)]|uniref:DUF1214 domain-containing protein n=1 Tax=Novosphingobium mangrovi (ex Huang et al. 2023) TaxID=2976432 RepID=A0ABT2I8H6_9SPHN|nr:DUF1214 domain-containing protein [Novosphingobium mangrovi (ex Huang et al. 2023)]MCT2401093.1 DUF1214 domain-containing protein [Novosphingobium mangrovi (ex Huang et al. 2023)]